MEVVGIFPPLKWKIYLITLWERGVGGSCTINFAARNLKISELWQHSVPGWPKEGDNLKFEPCICRTNKFMYYSTSSNLIQMTELTGSLKTYLYNSDGMHRPFSISLSMMVSVLLKNRLAWFISHSGSSWIYWKQMNNFSWWIDN